MRDAGTPALVLVLLAATAPAFGAFSGGILPSEPDQALAFVSFVLAAWIGVVLPSLADASPARVLTAAAVGAPFLAALSFASSAEASIPWAGLLGFVALGVFAAALDSPWRGRLAVLAACLLAAPALLESVGAAPPRALRPTASSAPAAAPGEPTEPSDLVPEAWRSEEGAASRRKGALAKTPAGPTSGSRFPLSGAAWSPVPAEARAHLPAAGPVVLVVGSGPLEGAPLGAAVVTTPRLPKEALELDAFDALVLLAPPAEIEAGAADALASFARRGGLLVGPVHPAAWPEALARRLGAAVAVSEAGPEAARVLGAGHVARAGGAADVRDLLAAGLASPRVGTAFDRALLAPSGPREFPRWRDDPRSRRGVLVLLAVFSAAAAFLGFVRGRGHAAGIALVAALASFGARLAASPESDVALRAFALDIGGLGGRRVEGLFLAAGPRGYAVPAGIASETGVRALGFSVRRIAGENRLVLGPRQEGWIVEESIGRGEGESERPAARVPAWADGLLVWGPGGSDQAKVAAGEAPYGGPRPGGLGEGAAAATVVLTAKRP